MAHLLELNKVSKFYASKDGVSTGFSKVDLILDRDEFVAITGESGSGKSTLINVISGLDTYEEGVLYINGEDTSGFVAEDYEKYRKEYIGNIFQDFNLIASYTVYQNIELVMLLSGRKASDCRARIKELIELVGLTKYTRTKVSKLSGGQKQRVAIARALAKDAPIIVCDEPTGNLDSASAAIVVETLAKIAPGRLVIVVSHNYEQIEPFVTRKITMNDGRIIEDKRISSHPHISDGRSGADPAAVAEGAGSGAAVAEGAGATSAYGASNHNSSANNGGADSAIVGGGSGSGAPIEGDVSYRNSAAAVAEGAGVTSAYGASNHNSSANNRGAGSASASAYGASGSRDSFNNEGAAGGAIYTNNSENVYLDYLDKDYEYIDEAKDLAEIYDAMYALATEHPESFGGAGNLREEEIAFIEGKRVKKSAPAEVKLSKRAAAAEEKRRRKEAKAEEKRRKKEAKAEEKRRRRGAKYGAPGGGLNGTTGSGGGLNGTTGSGSGLNGARGSGSNGTTGKCRAGSQVRLGVRNTFNLPAKFVLLFIVYFFLASSVLSQYSSLKNANFASSELGYNWYFRDTSSDRIILTKADGASFGDEDFQQIEASPYTKSVFRTDVLVDTLVQVDSDEYYIIGQPNDVDDFDESLLTAGRMPKNPYEFILVMDQSAPDYERIKENAEQLLGNSYKILCDDCYDLEWGTRMLPKKAKLVGLSLQNDLGGAVTTKMYFSKEACSRMTVKVLAALSKSSATCNGNKISFDMQAIYNNEHVPKGEAYVSESMAYSFQDEGKILGKEIKLNVSNMNFKDSKKLKVGAIFKESNIYALMEIDKKFYGDYSQRIYLNPKDYNALFNKPSYQCTVYVKNAREVGAAAEAYEKMGYETFVMKDSLMSEFDKISRMINLASFVFQVILLFLIAYAVIRLIMKSRNTYYSTLRILGASRSNTDNIIRIELINMMLISYGAVLGAGFLLRHKYSQINEVLSFLKPHDYLVLLAALLIMSLLIANGYARAIFKKSAMNTLREEA